MPQPYTAVGLIPTVRGIRKRAEIQRNLDTSAHLIGPPRGCPARSAGAARAVPEGALQGFTDEVLDLDHVTYARECAIDIPGPETDYLGDLAKHWNVFIMGQAKARHAAFPDRFFNVGFAIDPNGEVILKHYKLPAVSGRALGDAPRRVGPLDRALRSHPGRVLSGRRHRDRPPGGADGQRGLVSGERRGLAMNGAEVVYRASYPHPHTGNEFFEIQNRARALDNNFYIVAPNLATYYLEQDGDLPIDTFGGRSMIVDYKGRIVGQHLYGAGSSYVAGTVDIDALRDIALARSGTTG